MKPRIPTTLLAATVLSAAMAAQGAGTMAPTPEFPSYGDTVSLVLRGSKWPPYIPTTSFKQQGNIITFDFDVTSNGFNLGRPDYGVMPIPVGELLPGAYTVNARISDLDNPGAPPQSTTAYVNVSAPWTPDAYAVPSQPKAYSPWNALVTSAYFVYSNSLKVTVSPPVIRVSFEYSPTQAPGTAPFASIPVQGLAPGQWTIEATGTQRGGGGSPVQYRKGITVQRIAQVVEYYADATGHYFVTAGPGEIAALDSTFDWRRTGQTFNAWLDPANAPAGAVAVCRFYSSGPNSHFYTADGAECDNLKKIEVQQRAQTGGKAYSGWTYEGIAFYALTPTGGQCASGTDPVYRFYNNRWQQNDSNHRFPATSAMRGAMAFASWSDEGVAFCSPR